MRAVAQANLSASLRDPRKNQRAWVHCGCRATAEMAKANTVGEATAKCSRLVHRGSGDGTHEQTRRLKWGPSFFPPAWDGRLDNESISCRVEGRGSDEVIVSDDPAGQHNPLASQGPLDWIVLGIFLLSFPARGGLVRKDHYRRKTNETLAAYKSLCFGSIVVKVAVEFQFKAVLGKTRRTEFSRGRGKHRNPSGFAVRPLSTRRLKDFLPSRLQPGRSCSRHSGFVGISRLS
jgi:hypothetical protein